MNGDQMGQMGDEPGAVDNRLSLRPDDFPAINEWKDGETYPLADIGNAKLRQISAGEFEVMPGQAEPTEAGEEPGTTEQPTEEPNNEDKPADYPNPAVARLMSAKKQ